MSAKDENQIQCFAHEIPISDGDSIEVCIESTNSQWKQGVQIRFFGEMELDGRIIPGMQAKNAFTFWEDTAPRPFVAKIRYGKRPRGKAHHRPQEGHVNICNVWDVGDGEVSFGCGSAGMIVEKSCKVWRYRCCDMDPNEAFDALIFSVKELS